MNTSRISLYTADYYQSNQPAIDATATVGNIGELVTIGNYTYVSIKTGNFGSPDRQIARPLVEADMQTDLNDLRAGVINCYVMEVQDFIQVRETQLTEGEWYNPYTFTRWLDENLQKYRWTLTLIRENTDALSVSVLNPDGSFWYTAGAFIDQGDGTWTINSWDGGATVVNEEVSYEFIFGSLPITQHLIIPADIDELESNIAYGASTPNP